VKHAKHLGGHEKITDGFIMGLDILQAYDMAADLKHCVLSPGKEEMSLWHPKTWP
jgi:hypothetical protein